MNLLCVMYLYNRSAQNCPLFWLSYLDPWNSTLSDFEYHLKSSNSMLALIFKNSYWLVLFWAQLSLKWILCRICSISIKHLHHSSLISSLPHNSLPAVKVILMALPTEILSLSPILTGLCVWHSCGASVSPGPAGLGRFWTDCGPAGQGWTDDCQVRHPGGGPLSWVGGKPRGRLAWKRLGLKIAQMCLVHRWEPHWSNLVQRSYIALNGYYAFQYRSSTVHCVLCTVYLLCFVVLS